MDFMPGRTHAALAVAAGQPLLVRTFAEWREAARELLARDIGPHSVQWIAQVDGGDLFSRAPTSAADPPARLDGAAAPPRRPPSRPCTCRAR